MTALELLGVLAVAALVSVSVLYALAGLIRRDLEDQDDDAALYPSEYYGSYLVTLTAEQAAGMRFTFSDGSYRELAADGHWEWHPAPDTETASADPTR
ncbi:hypothetical protein SEA_NAIRB_38 [Mycobacterium phage Nairb]|uniref:Uncharacterized protein n=5 Tax=Bernalvirus bernal13 TaxID=1982102 RepID=A0A2P1JRR0_9CAUD|nr:membrane protein [Mycobacterium phage Bernal13]AIT13452.1 hypothetical protein PBI_RONRAYGUN_39 [Mycobacterium phage RonRayGun]ASJ79119.1 hypothetical protein SEA_ZENTIME222_38 [Mycobacterium phage ZenTime222]AVO21826.1 hypothetical protein SEA_NAIRB_38 [Mycobacterium phage Nairb]QBP28884.1 hypothetical protein SEA_IBRAHIM_39 [Mycobacterium phage Ibrahim]QHB47444.1 hypothetical protein SEA_WHITTY_39 [Mycobacterium phage Whitty]